MATWKKVIGSGSNAELLSVTSSFLGNLSGTASYASQGLSSSYALNATSASYALSSSYVLNSTSASYSLNATSASYALSSSFSRNSLLLNNTASSIFATTGSNIFIGSQTVAGNIFLSSSFPLVYNNDPTNNMLFGFFDGSLIYGAYYQTFGNQYAALNQRGGAEFVYDVRNNANANFHISSYDGNTWTQKFLVDDNGVQITGSLIVTNGITGSLLGTSSYALSGLSSSYALNATSASYALNSTSASYAFNATTASFAITASYVSASNVGGLNLSRINLGTVTASVDTGTTSFSLVSGSTPLFSVSNTGVISGSALIVSTITASNALVTNTLSVETITATSASFGYVETISGSAVIIGEEYIILNTQIPSARYAGL